MLGKHLFSLMQTPLILSDMSFLTFWQDPLLDKVRVGTFG